MRVGEVLYPRQKRVLRVISAWNLDHPQIYLTKRLGCLSLRCLSKEIPRAFLDFVAREIFFMCGNAPHITKRIGDEAVAVAPELVSYRHCLFCSSRNGLLEHLINVWNIE